MTLTVVTMGLLLAALATARVTRLITTDRLTERPRLWLLTLAVRWRGEESMLAYLLTCPWCVSVYAGAGMAGAWYAWGGERWFLAVTAALAFSYITGALASRESEA